MTTALATSGLLSPTTAAAGGGGGPSGTRVIFSLVDDAGDPAPGIDLSAAGVVQVSVNGANYANRAGAAPTAITGTGSNEYYYELDATEDLPGPVVVKIVKAGFQTVKKEAFIAPDPIDQTALDDAVTSIINALGAEFGVIQGDILAARDVITALITSKHATTDANVNTKAATLDASLQLILGLKRRNSMLDGGAGFVNVIYNSRRLMTNARLRVFASPAALAAAVAGHVDNADGEIYRFAVTGTDNGIGQVGVFKLVQELP